MQADIYFQSITDFRLFRTKGVDTYAVGVLAQSNVLPFWPGAEPHVVGTMDMNAWKNCFQCGQPTGYCNSVKGGNGYDQLSAFNTTVASYLSANPSPVAQLP